MPARMFLLFLIGVGMAADDEADPARATIINPYYETTGWKVWRDDPAPVADVRSMVREGKENKIVETTLAPTPADRRIYPAEPGGKDRFLDFRAAAEHSGRFAGIWDDVYASWSGLHGYVRSGWKGPAGDAVAIRDQIIHFVDVTKSNTLSAGVNFIHQSTTGMAHTITNGYSLPATENYEKLYFSDALLTAPAHSSFTDMNPEFSSDLFIALVPTLFNSVGSSNSETMAITKMILAGGHLPPATKLLLKRNGLYPAAMLYLWKAALPYSVPYGHELRHRVAYKSVGNRETYPESYGYAGLDKGDLALPFHRYDEAAHMRGMVELAKSMHVAPPEALLNVLEIEGGTRRYALRKSAVVIQEEGQTVRMRVSAADCYDLQGRALTVRWKLLHGNRDVAVEREGEGAVYSIAVPWDDALPEGRTALALIANNGAFDSNPAVITVYRKKGELPPDGASPGGYRFSGEFANRRPVILDLQDRTVRRGQTVRIPIRAIDPEGFPLRIYRRAGEVGGLDGSHFVWKCPAKAADGPRTVTLIASDGTSGNSYAGKTITIHVGKPKVMAQIAADVLTGPAPLAVKLSAGGSIGSRLEYGWEFRVPALGQKAKPFEELVHGRSVSHTFAKPGRYEIELTVKGASGTDTETVGVLVTAVGRPRQPASLAVEGNGIAIRNGDGAPCAFDHTRFGPGAEHEFRIVNPGDGELALKGSRPVAVTGPAARSFKVVGQPRKRIEGGGSTTFVIRFEPRGEGPHSATVAIRSGEGAFEFAIRGES